MNTRAPRSALASLGKGAFQALQGQLIVLWVLITLVPTLVVTLPLWKTLDGLLAHSVHAPAWASRFDGLMFSDVADALRGNAWISAGFVVGAVLTLLASPSSRAWSWRRGVRAGRWASAHCSRVAQRSTGGSSG